MCDCSIDWLILPGSNTTPWFFLFRELCSCLWWACRLSNMNGGHAEEKDVSQIFELGFGGELTGTELELWKQVRYYLVNPLPHYGLEKWWVTWRDTISYADFKLPSDAIMCIEMTMPWHRHSTFSAFLMLLYCLLLMFTDNLPRLINPNTQNR